jgi:zinc transport system substrate-binding protein
LKRFLVYLFILIVSASTWLLLTHRTETKVTLDSKIKINTSLPLLKYIVEQIGGDEVTVTSIIKGTNCNHEYEPTTADLKQVDGSQLFVKTGMGFDVWVDKLVANATSERELIIDASQGITAIRDDEPETDNHHNAWKGTAHAHELGNPHYWGNPENVRIMARNILKGLIEIAPEKKTVFENNFTRFNAALTKLSGELKAEVSSLRSKKILSYSAAFPYFYQYFGFDNQANVETTCEQEVSPKRLTEMTDVMKQQHIQIIVGEAVYPKLPQNLAEETGARIVLLWPATDESGDYLKTQKKNVELLITALK